MEWKTHAISGAIAGYFVSPQWETIVIGTAFGVLADLDEPRSKFGKLLIFVSIPISSIFPHRTFTHSLLFMAIVGLIGYLLQLDILYVQAMVLGLASHVVGDMLTGKVQLLYPFSSMVGIGIPKLTYVLIDRSFRYILLVGCIYLLYQEISQIEWVIQMKNIIQYYI